MILRIYYPERTPDGCVRTTARSPGNRRRIIPMKNIYQLLLGASCAAALFQACYSYPESIPLNTKICVQTSHHYFPIPDATVYVKFNADSFPGYLQKPEYFDKVFKTGKDARGCLEGVPEGNHWLIAFGYDSLHYPNEVFGNLPVTISIDEHPVVDTFLFVSEKH